MTIGESDAVDYLRAKKRVDVSIGESVRIIRELQDLSQNELAELSGIPQSKISAIECDRISLGVAAVTAIDPKRTVLRTYIGRRKMRPS